MGDETSSVASEVEDLAAKITADDPETTSVLSALTEEFEELGKLFKTLKTLRESLQTITSNEEELVSVVHSCVDVTASVIVRSRHAGTEVDADSLVDHMREVESLIALCGQRSRVQGAIKRDADRLEIAELARRINDLKEGVGVGNGITAAEESLLEKPGGKHRFIGELGRIDEGREEEKKKSGCLSTPRRAAAHAPEETPVLPAWHVPRVKVRQVLLDVFRGDAHPQLVGLTGDSGSGKTTVASEFIRSKEVLELFPDGIVWLSVNRGGKDRLSFLMWQLASMVHNHVLDDVGRAPAITDNCTSYIRKRVDNGFRVGRKMCLVVADNVWEPEVIAKLRETGMWVFVTTRQADLVADAGGQGLELGAFSQQGALSLLRGAAELAVEKELPEAATEVVGLCGRMAMDLSCVGRWSIVRDNANPSAWLDAAAAVREELRRTEQDDSNETAADIRYEQRMAILCAGLREVKTVDGRAHWLYLALALMPDDHPFSASDAAILLQDGPFETENESVVLEALNELESRSVFKAGGEDGDEIRMHNAHSDCARKNLRENTDVCRTVVGSWARHLSSLETVKSVDVHLLVRMWDVAELMSDDNFMVGAPYEAALSSMEESDPVLRRETLEAVVRFHRTKEDNEHEYSYRQQLLELEQKTLGPAHPQVLNTLTRLADCARDMQESEAAEEWYRKAERTSANVAFHAQVSLYDDAQFAAESLKSLGWSLMEIEEWSRAERMLLHALEIQELTGGPGSLKAANTLYKLGRCIREAGRTEEAEQILYRVVFMLEAKRKPNDYWLMVLTQEQLDLCSLELSEPPVSTPKLGVSHSMRV